MIHQLLRVSYAFSMIVLLHAFVTCGAAESLQAKRPNIILVMTDDQGMGDLSCLGNKVLKTPNLDRFYKLSTRFTDFHVSPTCSPTRSSMMSGRHEFYNGITHTINERERMALSTTTYPQLLQSSGYATGIFGKWHLGDEEAYQPYHRGFQQLDAGKPFLTYIAHNAPHGPMIAPEKYKKRFSELGYDEETSGRYGMIENIDDNFGRLMDKLDQWKAWDNTLVIFMTDNGQSNLKGKLNDKPVPLFSAGFKTGKGTPYEGGTHVPALWRWKGVLGEGVDIAALTAHIDLFKTFCELSGTTIPSDIQKLQGRSLVPLLENSKAAWADRNLFVHVGRWEVGADPNTAKFKNCAVRTQRWRFVNNKELFDISVDPYESKDVSTAHPEVIASLRAAYDTWWAEALPMMVNEQSAPTPQQPQAVRYEKQLAERGIPAWQPPSGIGF